MTDVPQSPETNPFGLADGLRYYVHYVEDYNAPSVRPPRRAVSTSYNGLPPPPPETPISSAQPPSTAGGIETILSPRTPAPLRIASGYFPVMTNGVSPSPIQPQATQSTSPSPEQAPTPPEPRPADLSPPPPPLDPTRLSSSATPRPASLNPRSTHHRISSRPSPPSFGPASIARPISVASSASSHLRAPSGAGPASKTAPTMAVSTSSDGPDSPGLPELQNRVLRKASSNSLSPAHEDLFRPSPLSEVSPPRETKNGLSPPGKPDSGSSGFTALGTGSAGRLMRGFSIGKKRRTSGVGAVADGKPSALDILRRFEGGGTS